MKNVQNGEYQRGRKKREDTERCLRLGKPTPEKLLRKNPFLQENLENIVWPWDMLFFGTETPDYAKMRCRIATQRENRRSAIPKVKKRGKRLRPLVISIKKEK